MGNASKSARIANVLPGFPESIVTLIPRGPTFVSTYTSLPL